MNDGNDSYWKDFVRSGSVADYLRYAESTKVQRMSADSTSDSYRAEG